MVITRDYKKIIAYQIADKLLSKVYELTSNNFPPEERYCLSTQLRRSALSIPGNIVEGSARKYKKEYIQFLYIAKGSLKETEYYLEKSFDFGYLNNNEFDDVINLCHRTGSLLYGLIKAVESTK